MNGYHIVPVSLQWLLSHHPNEPLFGRFTIMIAFSIPTQIPRAHNFDGEERKSFIFPDTNHLMFPTTEFAIANLFSSLLRFTTNPTTDGSSFSASAHIILNVVRGHNVSLCHSVKHYKIWIFKTVFIFIGLIV